MTVEKSELQIKDELLVRIFDALGIPLSYPSERGLPPYEQANLDDLLVTEIDFEGKPFLLTRNASLAWKSMKDTAADEGVSLLPFSGFRSYVYQQGLIQRHIDNGRAMDDILANLALPGYSEHHTGRAVDVTTAGCAPLVEEFEDTEAFKWLTENAESFGFYLSFARDNEQGFIYEPWHWCYKEDYV